MQWYVIVLCCIIFLILVTKEIENIVFDDYLFFITDVDECNNVTYSPCHANATCNNTLGSYICYCHEGYDGNGTNCTGMYLISFSVCIFMKLSCKYYMCKTIYG